MQSDDTKLDGPTRDLLVRLDERFSMVVGSVREIKDELHSLRRDLKEGDEALRGELKKEIREQLKILANRLDADEQRIIVIEQKVDVLETQVATNQGNQKGGRDILTLVLSSIAVLLSFLALFFGI